MIRLPTFRLLFAALVATLLAVDSPRAAIFSVGTPAGPGQPCTHSSLQAAINAANASPGHDLIRVTRSLSYEPAAYHIVTSQDLDIVGGYANCSQAVADGTRTIISGAFTGDQSVFAITANGSAVVKLGLLEIRRSPHTGIYFSGNGILRLAHTTVTQSRGAGIHANATGSDAELVIETGTIVVYNRHSGIRLSGPMEMTMAASETMIAYNFAPTSGGGLHVGLDAYAYIGSPGWSGMPAIHSNDAGLLGGGIHNLGTVKLFSTQAARPVSIVNNTAPYGAGIESSGRLCAWDFQIDRNAGGRGPAVHATGAVIMNQSNFPECTPHPYAVGCSASAACNSISGNISDDPAGAGAVHLDDGYLSANRVRMADNRAAFAIYGRDSDVNLFNCLLSGNVASNSLLAAEGQTTLGNTLNVYDCTIARNTIGSHTIHSANRLRIARSIIDQPGRGVQFLGNTSAYSASHLIVTELAGLPINQTIMQADPLFIAPDAEDFRLRFLSPAVDWAPSDSTGTLDLAGQPRTVDLTYQANNYGPRDLGAFERQHGHWDCDSDDAVFCDNFDLK